jgi:hypothetical protein
MRRKVDVTKLLRLAAQVGRWSGLVPSEYPPLFRREMLRDVLHLDGGVGKFSIFRVGGNRVAEQQELGGPNSSRNDENKGVLSSLQAWHPIGSFSNSRFKFYVKGFADDITEFPRLDLVLAQQAARVSSFSAIKVAFLDVPVLGPDDPLTPRSEQDALLRVPFLKKYGFYIVYSFLCDRFLCPSGETPNLFARRYGIS